MTLENAVRTLAKIVLQMDWKAFGGEQWLSKAQAQAEEILRAFPEKEIPDVDDLIRKVKDKANYTAGLGLTEHCQDGHQSAYREVIEILERSRQGGKVEAK